jgi:hypothetical protein
MPNIKLLDLTFKNIFFYNKYLTKAILNGIVEVRNTYDMLTEIQIWSLCWFNDKTLITRHCTNVWFGVREDQNSSTTRRGRKAVFYSVPIVCMAVLA